VKKTKKLFLIINEPKTVEDLTVFGWFLACYWAK